MDTIKLTKKELENAPYSILSKLPEGTRFNVDIIAIDNMNKGIRVDVETRSGYEFKSNSIVLVKLPKYPLIGWYALTVALLQHISNSFMDEFNTSLAKGQWL